MKLKHLYLTVSILAIIGIKFMYAEQLIKREFDEKIKQGSIRPCHPGGHIWTAYGIKSYMPI